MNRSKGFMIAGASAVAISLVMTGLMEDAALGAETASVANLCIAANGAVQVQRGTATCEARGKGSTAIAKGPGSSATATGKHNKARALGNGSTAVAGEGSNNTATARGARSSACLLYTSPSPRDS